MKAQRNPRIAVLIPFAARGRYWHPLLAELTRRFPRTTLFSCLKGEIPPPYRDAYAHRFVGAARHIVLFPGVMSPGLSMTLLPAGIVGHLLRFRPHVIFTSGFNLWSVLSLVFGRLTGAGVVILYDGSSPNVDLVRRSYRIALRRAMARRADALMTNSRAGKRYLVDVVKARERSVFCRPYLVPSTDALSAAADPAVSTAGLRHPVFLFVGRVSYRKGIPFLLEACEALIRRGRRDFSLLVVGAGPERNRWREQARGMGLESIVRWEGRVDYGRLGGYFQAADVFVFPSLVDVWGMTVLEAMAFAKPAICSRWAGASEIITEGENGFLFDPYRPVELADIMERFIEEPTLARTMGGRSREILLRLDPRSAAEGLGEVVRFVTSERRSPDSSTRTRSPRRSCRPR